MGHLGAVQTLRRSKSVGAGISTLTDDFYVTTSCVSANKSSNGCILAEELPPPDTVKNVRTVFEKLMEQFSPKTSSQESKSSIFSKKSLVRSVKSNPSSKIFRSESMRDDFPTIGSLTLRAHNSNTVRPYGKPILMPEDLPMVTTPKTEPPKKAEVLLVDRQVWQPLARNERKPVDKSKTNARPKSPVVVVSRSNSMEDEDDSGTILSSATEDNDDDEEEKTVSPDVLQRIRSCGTTTTYFGGHVVAKTVKNRKLPVDHVSSGRSSSTSNTDEGYYRDMGSPSNMAQSDGHEDLASNASDDNEEPPKPKDGRQLYHHHHLFLPLDSIFTATNGLDTTPRIIEVLPKSQSTSPAKSGSPTGSVIIEGRNSPEGCESGGGVKNGEDWVSCEQKATNSSSGSKDGNNNSLVCVAPGVGKKFTDIPNGAWF